MYLCDTVQYHKPPSVQIKQSAGAFAILQFQPSSGRNAGMRRVCAYVFGDKENAHGWVSKIRARMCINALFKSTDISAGLAKCSATFASATGCKESVKKHNILVILYMVFICNFAAAVRLTQ